MVSISTPSVLKRSRTSWASDSKSMYMHGLPSCISLATAIWAIHDLPDSDSP